MARIVGVRSAAKEPVLPRPGLAVRPSRAGRWRAFVLIVVHALIALHVAHWLATGSTLSPLEPSESMEFARDGLLNAGAIFFALAILSTLVFGRWFCGWACHVVALQDGARWLLLKAGWKPRELDLGPLALVPWLACVYMFLAPAAVRLLQQGGLAPRETHLATTDFWRTFPDWPVALLTFAVCGGLAVIVLGSKGFCSSGCPYGGIFGVVDQLAPWRIRVDSSCNGCGHCTAVCTSNVQVHAEVRDHGAVVDPGCMKCMDCVSSCPNGALRVGFGLPALFAKAAAATQGARRAAGRMDLPRQALRLGFALAAMALFHYYDGSLSAYANRAHWGVVALIGASAWLVALVFRSRTQKRRDCSLADEALLAAFFLAAMYAFRGLHDWFPFLLSLGWSSIVACLGLAAVRAAKSGEYALQAVVLRRAGRWTRAGALYGAACALLAGGTGLAAHEQWSLARSRENFRAGVEAGGRADWSGARARFEESLRHDPGYGKAQARLAFLQALDAAQAGDTDTALAGFEASLAADPAFAEARENLAGMLCATGRLEEGLGLFEESLRLSGPDPRTHALAARAALALGRADAARAHIDAGLRLAPLDAELRALLAELPAPR